MQHPSIEVKHGDALRRFRGNTRPTPVSGNPGLGAPRIPQPGLTPPRDEKAG